MVPTIDSKIIHVISVITFYFVVSISMVILNKISLDRHLPYPFFLTWLQFILAIVLCWFGHLAGKLFPSFSFFPPLEFDFNIALQIAPLTFIYVAMISTNNLCLQYVQLSFYQTARSLTVLWTVLFETIILHNSISWKRKIAVFSVFFGFLIGSSGELQFSWYGLFFGITSSLFVSLYGIFVKKVLPVVDKNQWKLLIYNTIMAIVLLFPFIFISGEATLLSRNQLNFDITTIVAIFASCITGWLINVATFLQIKVTSPLTNSIIGTAKATVQTLIGVVAFDNIITQLNLLGVFVVLAATWAYGNISYLEDEERHLKKSVVM